MTKESFMSEFVAKFPIGRTGWQARAAAEASAAWDDKVKVEAHAAACARAEKLWAAACAERATPAWRVEEVWGSHSFSNECYGGRAVYGGGNLTYEEAHARAAEITASPRCRRAGEAWDAYLNG